MTLIRHLKDTAELACFQRKDKHGTLEQAHERIDNLEDLICDLINNIRDRYGDEEMHAAADDTPLER
ncbi:MAG TPA: hypothetical protein VMB18_16235 [Terriglobales bacterium]|nr:hypothetical protein [Terriglobales bacterium]